MAEEWYTVKQVARMLNLPLRAVRIGRAIRVPKSLLEAFVRERLAGEGTTG